MPLWNIFKMGKRIDLMDTMELILKYKSNRRWSYLKQPLLILLLNCLKNHADQMNSGVCLLSQFPGAYARLSNTRWSWVGSIPYEVSGIYDEDILDFLLNLLSHLILCWLFYKNYIFYKTRNQTFWRWQTIRSSAPQSRVCPVHVTLPDCISLSKH